MDSRLSLVPAGVLPSVRAGAAELVAAAARAGHPVRNVHGYVNSPDHWNRRCVDYMINSRADGDWIAAYAWTHRQRLGLVLMIWHLRIKRTYRKGLIPAGRWGPYFGESSHKDHVHIEVLDQPYKPPRTSFLGPYAVNPAEVRTFLWQIRPDGSRGAQRPPGYVIRTGVAVVKRDGREWLLTQAGNRYALDYLHLLPRSAA